MQWQFISVPALAVIRGLDMNHEQAIKRIGRYLLGNSTNGLITRLTNDLTLNCSVDADFCGLYNYDDAEDLDSVRSLNYSGKRTSFLEQ